MAAATVLCMVVGVLAGVEGISGGNFLAIIWVAVLGRGTLEGTASGAACSAVLMTTMVVLRLADGSAHPKDVAIHLVAVAVPNGLSVVLGTYFIHHLSEMWLSFCISVVLLVVGVFGTIYTLQS